HPPEESIMLARPALAAPVEAVVGGGEAASRDRREGIDLVEPRPAGSGDLRLAELVQDARGEVGRAAPAARDADGDDRVALVVRARDLAPPLVPRVVVAVRAAEDVLADGIGDAALGRVEHRADRDAAPGQAECGDDERDRERAHGYLPSSSFLRRASG